MWTNDDEIDFLNKAKSVIGLDNLMIKINSDYYVYAPKKNNNKIITPQGRNSLIGKYTEHWCKKILEPIAHKHNLFAINNVICPEIGLTNNSGADLAFCSTNSQYQKSENIKIIFEIKMSITNNYIFNKGKDNFLFLGDINSHKGIPSLLRSDSMLKAIGKSINIRVDSEQGKKIPIFIIGNTPISKNYEQKVDSLYTNGIIQKFISVNPSITNSKYNKSTKKNGFVTANNIEHLESIISPLLHNELYYFSAMINNKQLGQIIETSNQESSYELKAQKFLHLIKEQL